MTNRGPYNHYSDYSYQKLTMEHSYVRCSISACSTHTKNPPDRCGGKNTIHCHMYHEYNINNHVRCVNLFFMAKGKGQPAQHSGADVTEEEEEEEDDGEIRCVCGEETDKGLMIQCEKCLVWQHGACMDIKHEDQVPDNWFCELCQRQLELVSTERFMDQLTHKQNRIAPASLFSMIANLLLSLTYVLFFIIFTLLVSKLLTSSRLILGS